MRKGQAASEFLLTYGWAIVVVLLMIGGLAYLGVLDFGKVLPSKCFFGAGISCKDQNSEALSNGHTEINALLTNTFGIPINTSTITIEDHSSGCVCNPVCGLENQEWEEKSDKLITIDCATPVDRIDIKIKIKYKIANGQYDRIVEGLIQTRS